MDPKTEQEVVRGLLPFTVNGSARNVPELKRRANREWQAANEAAYAALGATPYDTPAGVRAMGDAQLALILTYDAMSCPDYRAGAPTPCHAVHVLGDLEDATEREVDAIYERLLEVAYPKSNGPMALMLGIAQQAVKSALANSTNGQSPTGITAAPTSSTTPSPSVKSASSTGKRKSA